MGLILALETTERYGSVALLRGKQLITEHTLPEDRRSAQSLTPAVSAVFRENGFSPSETETIAVIIGPGSFTGLRIGVATAKMFAYAVKGQIVGIGTHDAVVRACYEASFQEGARLKVPDHLSVGVDAQRGEVVVVRYERTEKGTFKALGASELTPADVWWKDAEQFENVCFAGPALERWREKAPQNVQCVKEELWRPRASIAGLIAAERCERSTITDDLWSLMPVYSRPSAAEECASALKRSNLKMPTDIP